MTKKYLNVSYQDRELAKKLGAKWDPSVRRWYCPAGSHLAKIFSWRKAANEQAVRMAANHNALEYVSKNKAASQASLFDFPMAG